MDLGVAHQLAVFQFELTVVNEFGLVFAIVPCQDVVEGGLMLSTLLPASECFGREGRPTTSLLIDPVKQTTNVLPSGEACESCFQRSERGIGCGDFLIPGRLFIKEGMTGQFGFGFDLSRGQQLHLGQSRLLRGESGESEEGGMELVHMVEGPVGSETLARIHHGDTEARKHGGREIGGTRFGGGATSSLSCQFVRVRTVGFLRASVSPW